MAPFLKPPFLQATDYFVVTPSDTLDVKDDPANPEDYQIVALFIGDTTEVNVTVVSPHDATSVRPITFTVTGPISLPILCKRIMDTGTDATNIIALVSKL